MTRYLVLKRRRLFIILPAVILGVIIGAVLVTINMGHQVDQLIIEKENLNNELSSVRKELEQIKDNQKKRKGEAINSIEAVVTFPKESFSKYEGTSLQLELEKKIVEMLEPLNGKEIRSLDPELIPRIVDGRRLTIENRDFTISVNMVIISQELKLFALAKPGKAQEDKSTF